MRIGKSDSGSPKGGIRADSRLVFLMRPHPTTPFSTSFVQSYSKIHVETIVKEKSYRISSEYEYQMNNLLNVYVLL